jgi:cellulose synthase/poly-beta-1,6-N-acetylglucosamine synthase-like glycosyltransferase
MQFIILLVSLALFIFYAALIIYYAAGWRSIPSVQLHSTPGIHPKISVIIPARNEAANIKACLDSICIQSYPAAAFEVIVMDDHSTDHTASIVQQYPAANVRLLQLSELVGEGNINSYKKKAIELAIQQANGELIVTTDADCIVPANWLQTIAAFYMQTNAVFIAMPVVYSNSHRLIEIFQSLDFMTLQGITGASVYKKIHSMCNGANLAYTKKAFESVGGFKGIDNIASGDDMLLMHKIYQQYPDKVLFLKSKEVIVQTAPMKTVKDFFNQRIRWASKADKYDDKRIFVVLLLVYLFNVLLALLPAFFFFRNSTFNIQHSTFNIFELWLYLMLFKTIIELIFLYPVAKFFSKQQLLWFFPVAQPFHICYTVIAGWLGKFGTYQWKERNVK